MFKKHYSKKYENLDPLKCSVSQDLDCVKVAKCSKYFKIKANINKRLEKLEEKSHSLAFIYNKQL